MKIDIPWYQKCSLDVASWMDWPSGVPQKRITPITSRLAVDSYLETEEEREKESVLTGHLLFFYRRASSSQQKSRVTAAEEGTGAQPGGHKADCVRQNQQWARGLDFHPIRAAREGWRMDLRDGWKDGGGSPSAAAPGRGWRTRLRAISWKLYCIVQTDSKRGGVTEANFHPKISANNRTWANSGENVIFYKGIVKSSL